MSFQRHNLSFKNLPIRLLEMKFIYEGCLEFLKKCWAENMMSFRSQFWSSPSLPVNHLLKSGNDVLLHGHWWYCMKTHLKHLHSPWVYFIHTWTYPTGYTGILIQKIRTNIQTKQALRRWPHPNDSSFGFGIQADIGRGQPRC